MKLWGWRADHLKPIKRVKPLVEQVYEWLREEILAGKIRAGERIVETQLAVDLQVSRSPVREAIRLLTVENLLVEQNGNIYVFQPSLRDFQELYELRLAIEPIAASKAAMSRNTDVCTKLEQNLTKTSECLSVGNMAELLHLNYEFHQIICEASGNARFIRLIETASALIRYYCLLVLDINQKQTNILREHMDIYTGIREGQPERAHDAMNRHIMKDLLVIQNQSQALSAQIG